MKFLMLLSLTSCGSQEPSRPGGYETPVELQSLVDDFSMAMGRPVITPVEFGSELDFQREGMDPDTVGVCMANTNTGINRVMILRHYWDDSSNIGRWAVVFHELGHCELGREHLNEIAADACAVSIMRWELSTVTDCVNRHKRTTYDYERELFNP